MSGKFNSIRCFAVRMRPRWPSHIFSNSPNMFSKARWWTACWTGRFISSLLSPFNPSASLVSTLCCAFICFHSQPGAIQTTFEEDISTINDSNNDLEDEHCVLRMAKPICLKPMTETAELVRTSSSGIMSIDSHP